MEQTHAVWDSRLATWGAMVVDGLDHALWEYYKANSNKGCVISDHLRTLSTNAVSNDARSDKTVGDQPEKDTWVADLRQH